VTVFLYGHKDYFRGDRYMIVVRNTELKMKLLSGLFGPMKPGGAAISFCICACLIGCASTAKQSSDASNNDNQLASEFIAIAYEHIDQSNIFIDPTARQLLDDFVVQGAARLREEPSSDEALRTAEENLVVFVEALVDEAILTDDGAWVITEESFANALKRCPLWPFCV
jgi:hypothetical protein